MNRVITVVITIAIVTNALVIAAFLALFASVTIASAAPATVAAQPVVKLCVQSRVEANASTCTLVNADGTRNQISVVRNITAMPAQFKSANGMYVSNVTAPTWISYGSFVFEGSTFSFSW